jgi:hypothetical protein
MDDQEQRREHYRLEYPPAERPLFVAGDLVLRVADISERGLGLVITPESPVLGDGTVLEGTIQFRHADPLDVTALVVRHEPGLLGLRLYVHTIPFATVLTEERAILSRYAR